MQAQAIPALADRRPAQALGLLETAMHAPARLALGSQNLLASRVALAQMQRQLPGLSGLLRHCPALCCAPQARVSLGKAWPPAACGGWMAALAWRKRASRHRLRSSSTPRPARACTAGGCAGSISRAAASAAWWPGSSCCASCPAHPRTAMRRRRMRKRARPGHGWACATPGASPDRRHGPGRHPRHPAQPRSARLPPPAAATGCRPAGHWRRRHARLAQSPAAWRNPWTQTPMARGAARARLILEGRMRWPHNPPNRIWRMQLFDTGNAAATARPRKRGHPPAKQRFSRPGAPRACPPPRRAV